MKSSHWRWHLDAVFLKITGERHNRWRAVDHEGKGSCQKNLLEAGRVVS